MPDERYCRFGMPILEMLGPTGKSCSSRYLPGSIQHHSQGLDGEMAKLVWVMPRVSLVMVTMSGSHTVSPGEIGAEISLCLNRSMKGKSQRLEKLAALRHELGVTNSSSDFT